MRSLHAGSIVAVIAAVLSCRSPTNPPPSLTAGFTYTVRRVNGDTLTFSGTSLNWVRQTISGGTSLSYDFILYLLDPVQIADSALLDPNIKMQVAGQPLQTCPLTFNTNVGVRPASSLSMAATLYLQHMPVAVADSGQLQVRVLADSVVSGALDLWFSTPAPAFRLTGTYTAHGGCA